MCPTPPCARPQEILTIANALLGQGQLSLAKYLLDRRPRRRPGARHPRHRRHSSRHLLERVDWRTDLHFQTRTTIDTLDYSGHGLNQGSKVVIAAAGPSRRTLATELPGDLRLPAGFRDPRVVLPGILAIQGPALPRRIGRTSPHSAGRSTPTTRSAASR